MHKNSWIDKIVLLHGGHLLSLPYMHAHCVLRYSWAGTLVNVYAGIYSIAVLSSTAVVLHCEGLFYIIVVTWCWLSTVDGHPQQGLKWHNCYITHRTTHHMGIPLAFIRNVPVRGLNGKCKGLPLSMSTVLGTYISRVSSLNCTIYTACSHVITVLERWSLTWYTVLEFTWDSTILILYSREWLQCAVWTRNSETTVQTLSLIPPLLRSILPSTGYTNIHTGYTDAIATLQIQIDCNN